jgi:hypothetical protein
MSRLDKKLRARKVHMVAFGRCVPKALRVPIFNEDLFDDLYQINCPPDLQSLKIVFDTILHLRSTQYLIEYLKKNPDLPRAKFLVDQNFFDPKSPFNRYLSAERPLWSYFYK